MSLILVTHRSGNVTRLHVSVLHWLAFGLLFISLLSLAAYLGRWQDDPVTPRDMFVQMEEEIAYQREEIESTNKRAEENMDVLAARLGDLKAHVIRLDALGSRLIDKAKLSNGEFDFTSSPAQGGPASKRGIGSSLGVADFLADIDVLGKKIENRSLQLAVMESMLMNRGLQDEVRPAGRPVKSGWISSYYGKRTDPFTGRLAHHAGIDIAGAEGSDVIAVAAGVVTWASNRYGYGKLVEINHGNGYVTRYGHSKSVLVKLGQQVKKGQTISLMGSSGRSTGPHVHFEVIKNGRTVNPIRYVHAR